MAVTYPKVKGADKYDMAFEEFVTKYSKNYASDVERMERFSKFKNTYDHIETENAKENSYKYIAGGGQAGTCKASGCTKGLAAGAVTGFHDVGANSEQNMLSALALGPVSIAVEADKATFQSYRSGIMTGLCGTNLDHGILAIGYGTDSGSKYWWVKNSWGEQWGISGFGKLERGKGGGGECGLLMAATYPKVRAGRAQKVLAK